MSNPEIDAITKIDAALSAIKDKESKRRVLRWALDKFSAEDEITSPSVKKSGPDVTDKLGSLQKGKGEIPGIARIQENGTFRLTVRDLKAKNTNDAAIRLAHIVIRAYGELTGETSVSSKKVLVPILREWRAYDGNTRVVIARHKGIIREGDSLSLDAHSNKDAFRFMSEVLDSSITGTWSPRSTSRKRSAAKAGSKT